jgi:electron transport complex protein RnfA
MVYAISVAVGFGFSLTLFAGIREQLEFSKIPKGMQGTPIALLTASILALAFMGFAGLA